MNEWNYTKKAAKIGFLYGVACILYVSLLSNLAMNSSLYCNDLWFDRSGGFLAFGGMVLFMPLFISIIPLELLFSQINIELLFFLVPLISVLIFAVFGLFVDYIKKKCQDVKKFDKINNNIFWSVPLGEKSIEIKEKVVNYCIVAGIILWVSLFALNMSCFTAENEIRGEFVKGGSASHPFYFNSDNTFSEYYPNDTEEIGTYEITESLLILYYSDGKVTKYYVTDIGLIPVDIDLSNTEEVLKNKLLKVVIQ